MKTGQVESFQQYVRGLRDSRLLDTAALTSALAEFEKTTSAPDYAAFGRYLVEQDLITRWHHRMLVKRKSIDFYLGKYKLLEPLGSGGMGAVFRALHTKMLREVAVKLLPKSLAKDQSTLAQFHREAQAIAALNHPNIVRAYEVDNDREVHYLVMEYVPGKDLAHLVEKDGPLPFGLAADCIRQAAEGLAHAHQSGIIHRDVKPANLLLGKNGTLKIVDMGIARLAESEPGSSGTDANTTVGTADYQAPEQALDSRAVDAKADVYSLGATLYFLLTGSPPFAAETLAQVILKHQTAEPPPMDAVRPNTPPALMELCARMMAKAPEDRPSAEEVAETLEEWLRYGATGSSVETAETSTLGTVIHPRGSSEFDFAIRDSDEETNSSVYNLPQRKKTSNAQMLYLSGAIGAVGIVLIAGVIYIGTSGPEPAAQEEPQFNREAFASDDLVWNPAGNDQTENEGRPNQQNNDNATDDDDEMTLPGTLIAYEPFDRWGPLVGKQGGGGFDGKWQEAGWSDGGDHPFPTAVLRKSRSFKSRVESSGNCVFLRQANEGENWTTGGLVKRQLNERLANDVFYCSFLIMPNSEVGKGPYGGYAGVDLGLPGKALFVGFAGIGDTGYGVGISGKGESTVTVDRKVKAKETSLLVVRMTLQPGKDVFDLYVDPPLDREPDKPDATLTDLDLPAIKEVHLTWTGEFKIDELRIGRTYEDVTATMKITRFVLYNAETDKPVRELKDGDVVQAAEVPPESINVVAEVVGPVASVVFDLDDKKPFKKESVPAYALFGNEVDDFKGGNLAPGEHQMTATPHAEPGGRGKSGPSRTLTFRVEE